NAARYLDETLRSVLAQTLSAGEIIVVDDASTDDTAARARAYGGAVRLIHCERNSGGCGTPRNIGIAAARTTFVAPFDADDVMHPDKLRWQMETVKAAPE